MANIVPRSFKITKLLIGLSLLASILIFFLQFFGITLFTLFAKLNQDFSHGINILFTILNIFFLIFATLSYFNLESGVNPKALMVYMLFGFYLILPLLAIYFISRTESLAFYAKINRNYNLK